MIQFAFPDSTINGQSGLTTEQWFATHAPSEIPSWFRLEFNPPPIRTAPHFKYGKGSSHPKSALVMRYWNDEEGEWIPTAKGNVPKAFMKEFEQYIKDYQSELFANEKYQQEHVIRRYFAWRKHYGRMMAEQQWLM